MKIRKRKKMISAVSFLIIVAYGIIIIYFTLFSDRLGRTVVSGDYRYNLVPFTEIRRFIYYRNLVSPAAFLLNIFGNLLVFAPLGFLIPLWNQKNSRGATVLVYSFSFSLCIEVMQLISRVGVFDVDDLIMNTIGGLIGWSVYWLVNHMFQISRRKKRL